MNEPVSVNDRYIEIPKWNSSARNLNDANIEIRAMRDAYLGYYDGYRSDCAGLFISNEVLEESK